MPPRTRSIGDLRPRPSGPPVPEFHPLKRGHKTAKMRAIEDEDRAALTLRPSTDEAKLNKTEAAWLDVLRGRYQDIGIQNLTLKIANDCRYTPDFITFGSDGLTLWEVKGFMREDALVKVKAAARMWRWARVVVVTRKNGRWHEAEVKP